MKLSIDNIKDIVFWKRSSESVEIIHQITICRSDNEFLFCVEKESKTQKKISSEQVENIINQLINTCEILNTEDSYQAFKYENDKTNFSLKFYLEIESIDYEYIAVKGILPFKQPHYQQIVSIFNPLFQ